MAEETSPSMQQWNPEMDSQRWLATEQKKSDSAYTMMEIRIPEVSEEGMKNLSSMEKGQTERMALHLVFR